MTLESLVDPLQREVNPPGGDLFPDATDDDFIGALINAFWELRIYGLLESWEENAASRGGPATFVEGVITPIRQIDPAYDAPAGWADTDMGRDLQQLVVLWAAWTIVLNRVGSVNSVFKVTAGTVSYETQNAATVLKGLLDQLKERIDNAIYRLQLRTTATSVVLDAVVERSYSQAVGLTWWVRS